MNFSSPPYKATEKVKNLFFNSICKHGRRTLNSFKDITHTHYKLNHCQFLLFDRKISWTLDVVLCFLWKPLYTFPISMHYTSPKITQNIFLKLSPLKAISTTLLTFDHIIDLINSLLSTNEQPNLTTTTINSFIDSIQEKNCFP